MKNNTELVLPVDLTGKQPLVLFDGDCSLCSSSVRFLLRHNHRENLSFVSLQSATGSEIILLAGTTFQKADTLLLLQDNKLYGYSTAALKITAHLGFPLRLLRYFLIVPPVIRDFIYRFISVNRYSWFGRKPFCMTDNQAYQKRFLS
jgi:predicted DCC family thiol-disulfide oxidoreductase YuxK